MNQVFSRNLALVTIVVAAAGLSGCGGGTSTQSDATPVSITTNA